MSLVTKTKSGGKKNQVEAFIKTPLPYSESLGAFFRDLGIDNFIIRKGTGSYCASWGNIGLNQLDDIALRDSYNEDLADGHVLEHASVGLENSLYSDENFSFGVFEQPWFVAVDGTKYTFESAKFIDGHFNIGTKFEKGTKPPLYGIYTISELREMIGALPPKLVKQRGFLSAITSLFR